MGTSEELSEGLRSFGRVYAWLKNELIDRETEVRLALTCLVAQQHLFLLGPPGTGKSYLAILIGRALGKNSGFFQLLLTRFTDPSEVFGPVSVKDLVQGDRFGRKTQGYLPTAECAFLDEIWKSSSAILNSLLTIVNERVYDNGGRREKVPLKTLFSASNELPQDEALDALYDRFLVRREVRPVRDPLLLLDRQDPGEAPSFEHLQVIQEACRKVEIPNDVKLAMKAIKDRLLREERIEIGDRRFQQSASLVRACAILDGGREEAKPEDLVVLAHSWWRTPDQFLTVSRIVNEEARRLLQERTQPEAEEETSEEDEELPVVQPKRSPPAGQPRRAPAPPVTQSPSIPPGIRQRLTNHIVVPQTQRGAPGGPMPWASLPATASAPAVGGGVATGWIGTVTAIIQKQPQQLIGDSASHNAIHDALQAPEARDPTNKHYVDRLAKLKGALLNQMKWLGPTW